MNNYKFKPTPEYTEVMRDRLKKYCKPGVLNKLILETTGKKQSIDELDGNALDAIFDNNKCSVMRPEGICESLISDTGYYNVPVSWVSMAVIQVEADNLADAIEKAKNAIFNIPLPSENVQYLEDSFAINVEEDEDAISASYYSASEVIMDKNGNIDAE